MQVIDVNPSEGYFVFSGGEVHCKSNTHYGADTTIVCRDYTANGFLAVCMHNEILRRQGSKKVHLVYPYLPYARQDRVIAEREPFSLKVFAQLINAQNFDSVTVYDAHSDVGPGLIDRCINIPQSNNAGPTLSNWIHDEKVFFVSPDAGAYKKVSKLIDNDNRIIIATKERGKDGAILRTKLLTDGRKLKGRDIVIVDDICDGGRTFIELGKVIRGHKPKSLILYVTHGIFSKGFGELNAYFDHIYTTNSFPNKGPKSLVTAEEIF